MFNCCFRKFRIIFFVTLGISLLLIAGCQELVRENTADVSLSEKSTGTDGSADDSKLSEYEMGSMQPSINQEQPYRLKSGDVIHIKLYFNPELNELVTIRPDGYISLQLIDEVKASGRTPAELDTFLTDLYTSKLQDPEVAVIVKETVGRRVYIGGEVNVPRQVPINGRLTLLQTVMEAGGFKKGAEYKRVIILRYQGTAEPKVVTVDLRRDSTTGMPMNDMLLQPYDVVLVPKSDIAKVGDFIDQYVNELVPTFLQFGLVYNLNPEVTLD